MSKTDDQLFNEYLLLEWPGLVVRDEKGVRNSIGFAGYLLRYREKELKNAVIDSLPMFIRKYFLRS